MKWFFTSLANEVERGKMKLNPDGNSVIVGSKTLGNI